MSSIFKCIVIAFSFLVTGCEGQNITNQQYDNVRKIASSPNFPLREMLDYLLQQEETLDVKIIAKPFEEDGIFVQQYVLTVLKDYPSRINFRMLHDLEVLQEDNSLFPGYVSGNELKEAKIQLTIEHLHQKKIYDYLLERGLRTQDDWQEIAIKIEIDPISIQKFIDSPAIDNLLRSNYQWTKKQKQENEYLFKIGNQGLFIGKFSYDGFRYFQMVMHKK